MIPTFPWHPVDTGVKSLGHDAGLPWVALLRVVLVTIHPVGHVLTPAALWHRPLDVRT